MAYLAEFDEEGCEERAEADAHYDVANHEEAARRERVRERRGVLERERECVCEREIGRERERGRQVVCSRECARRGTPVSWGRWKGHASPIQPTTHREQAGADANDHVACKRVSVRVLVRG